VRDENVQVVDEFADLDHRLIDIAILRVQDGDNCISQLAIGLVLRAKLREERLNIDLTGLRSGGGNGGTHRKSPIGDLPSRPQDRPVIRTALESLCLITSGSTGIALHDSKNWFELFNYTLHFRHCQVFRLFFFFFCFSRFRQLILGAVFPIVNHQGKLFLLLVSSYNIGLGRG